MLGKRFGVGVAFMGMGISLSCSVDSKNDYSYGGAGSGNGGGAGRPSASSGAPSTAGAAGSHGSGASGASATGTGGRGGASSGGAIGDGGIPGSGGTAVAGGTTGAAGTDGSGAAGGDDPQGGAGGESSSTGGTTASGGITSGGSGGNATTGGVTGGSGGNATTGGTTGGSGGKVTTGGTTGGSGGKATTGGVTSTGGAPPVVPPSCTGLAAQCQGESCCTSIPVPGGTFKMGRSLVPTGTDYVSATEDDETPEHSATVAAFKLDKYEVTVGRFRKFHANYRQWHVTGQNPRAGDGLHPIVGRTGWGQSWTELSTNLPADEVALAASLTCNTSQETWTDTASSPTAAAESYPINCVTWYVAFAFCLWDGGRLPTEAEWEFVAAAGTANASHPWGAAPVDNTRANYGASNATPYLPVGSKPAGAGALGHLDLSGSMREWVFDWFHSEFYGTAAAPAACVNCVNWQQTFDTFFRSNRGGSWLGGVSALRAADRWEESDPDATSGALGLRCAR